MKPLEYCGKIVTKSCTTPISTIVYLADRLEDFKHCLFNLQRDNSNIVYLYCVHKGENGDKDHIHLILFTYATNGFKNCEKLRNYFILSDNEKSYAKNFIVTKSLGDAYKYLYHDKTYLDNKNEIREFYYTENDVFGSDDLRELCLSNTYIESQLKTNNENGMINNIIDCLSQGLSKFEILEKCTVNKTSFDYISSLNLIEKIEKISHNEINNNYEYLKKCLHKYLLSNSSYETFNGSVPSTYRCIKNDNDILDDILQRLCSIDLIDFVFNNKIKFL